MTAIETLNSLIAEWDLAWAEYQQNRGSLSECERIAQRITDLCAEVELLQRAMGPEKVG